MNRLNIGIAEDRDIQAAYYQEIIRKELSRHELHLKHYRSTQECLADQEFLAEADIFLINIQLDGSSGIELGRQLMQAHSQIKIIFISGYVRYAPEVYEVPHVYFVWKPDLEVRLPQALQAACRESRRSVLPLNWKGHKKFIFMDEIMYIERELRKSRIVLPECEHYVYMTLEELMERLQEQRFIRIHKSYIVNFDYIGEFCRQMVVLRDGTQLPVSRTYRAAVSEVMHKLLKESGVSLDEDEHEKSAA